MVPSGWVYNIRHPIRVGSSPAPPEAVPPFPGDPRCLASWVPSLPRALASLTQVVPHIHLAAEGPHLDDCLPQKVVRLPLEPLLHAGFDVIVLIPDTYLDAVRGVVTFAVWGGGKEEARAGIRQLPWAGSWTPLPQQRAPQGPRPALTSGNSLPTQG